MSSLVQRRDRIARVRNIQHILASAEAARAEERVEQLESTEQRLLALSHQMTPLIGASGGQRLASAGEMVQRLAKVRDGLADAIVGARATAHEQAALRIEARIRQESAERLRDRAVREREARAEARRARIPFRQRAATGSEA